MYIVVSKWLAKEGKWDEFEKRGAKVRQTLRSTPGVSFVHAFVSDSGDPIAVVGYESREAYDRIVNDPSGPFESALADNSLEDVAEWVWSERGNALD